MTAKVDAPANARTKLKLKSLQDNETASNHGRAIVFLCQDGLDDGAFTATMASDRAPLMPPSLDALTTLDLTLIATVVILIVVSGGLALRLQRNPQPSKTDDKPDLRSSLSELQEQLKAAQAETEDAREESELTLLQLHQVQEELEHYFLDSRSKEELLQKYSQQTNDMKKMIVEISRSKA